jgi:hypothetical protein
VLKWFKFIIALCLLPFCYGSVVALWRVLEASGNADAIWVPFLAGAACWLVIFLLLPKPMWVYVLGHEMTHAVWTWVFGGKVTAFRASSSGGHVKVSKVNFVIALAPYFFPFYAVLLVLVFVLGQWLWGWQRYAVWFHLLLGAAYSFHLTLTFHILRSRQSDIVSQGYLFSAVVIFLGNATVLILGLPLLMGLDPVNALSWWWQSTRSLISS